MLLPAGGPNAAPAAAQPRLGETPAKPCLSGHVDAQLPPLLAAGVPGKGAAVQVDHAERLVELLCKRFAESPFDADPVDLSQQETPCFPGRFRVGAAGIEPATLRVKERTGEPFPSGVFVPVG
jgi:hypothetical protein